MEERVLNKFSLATIGLTFLIGACSHSPTTPKTSSSATTNKTTTNSIAQKADFISPPLSKLVDNNSVIQSKSNQLIWQHIENGFELTELYDHPRVLQQKKKFLANTEFLEKSTKRSEPFIHFVLSEIENRQLPTELAILPIIESGYYPRARSRAKAEGLWQIMPYTGKELGLKRLAGYDGRHDVYESTMAALNYLTQMYNTFDGDWLLALAAYNAGPQRVKRALRQAKVVDKDVYWNLRLPRETREYVPKILAVSAIIKDLEISSSFLYPIEDKPYVANIKLSKRISPAELAQTAETSESEIKLLNPAIRNLSTPIPAGYQLLVPKQDVLRKTSHRQSVAQASRKNSTPAIIETESVTKDTNIDEPYVYIVAMGDSYWKIANRNNTTVKRLYEINGRRPDQPLQPGETLLVD